MWTRASLKTELDNLGLRPGDTILCHASLSALGYVCGGAVAVVQALLDVLGPTGTLIVPAQTAFNRDPATWTEPMFTDESTLDLIRKHLPGFEPDITPSQGVGVIAEQVRTWPGACRSAHPQTSFAGIGPRAESLLSGHALSSPLGEQSPLARLVEADARVLLLGVGMHRVTAFHLAEYRVPGAPHRTNSCAVVESGQRRWVTYPEIVLNDSDFGQLGQAYEAMSQAVTTGSVGDAICRLFDIRSAVAFATRWIPANRVAHTPL